jgi:hypothetical protein
MWRMLRSFVLLTSVMIFGAETFVGVAQLNSRDFLAAYRGIVPGESLDSAEAERCDLHVGMTAGVETAVCRFEAGNDVFGRVTVIERDHIIQRVGFEVLPDALMLGDLILCWGSPSQHASLPAMVEGTHTTTRWEDRIYAGHSFIQRGSSSYFIPVTYISLEKEGALCTET